MQTFCLALRRVAWVAALVSFALVPARAPAAPPAPALNYAEALQKSIVFFECQESGRLSPASNAIVFDRHGTKTDDKEVAAAPPESGDGYRRFRQRSADDYARLP